MELIRKLKIYIKRFYSINKIDQKMLKYINFKNGYYIECGANDGIRQSNTFHFEKSKGWKGVLIEPSPHNFQKCVANRGLNNSIFCNACVGFEYKEKYVDMIDANLMSISNNLDLDLQENITSPDFEEESFNIENNYFKNNIEFQENLEIEDIPYSSYSSNEEY